MIYCIFLIVAARGTYIRGEADRELSSQADVNFMQDGGRHRVLIREERRF